MRTSRMNWKLQLVALAGILSLAGCGSGNRIPEGQFRVTVSNSVHSSTIKITEMTLTAGIECDFSISHSNRTGTGSSGGALNSRSGNGVATSRVLFTATVGSSETGAVAISVIKTENGATTSTSLQLAKGTESSDIFDLPEMNRTFAFTEKHTIGSFLNTPLKLSVRPKKDSQTSP